MKYLTEEIIKGLRQAGFEQFDIYSLLQTPVSAKEVCVKTSLLSLQFFCMHLQRQQLTATVSSTQYSHKRIISCFYSNLSAGYAQTIYLYTSVPD